MTFDRHQIWHTDSGSPWVSDVVRIWHIGNAQSLWEVIVIVLRTVGVGHPVMLLLMTSGSMKQSATGSEEDEGVCRADGLQEDRNLVYLKDAYSTKIALSSEEGMTDQRLYSTAGSPNGHGEELLVPRIIPDYDY